MMTMIFFFLYKTFTLDVSQKNSFYIFCINVSTGNIYIFFRFPNISFAVWNKLHDKYFEKLCKFSFYEVNSQTKKKKIHGIIF